MLEKADGILKLAIALAILCGGLSVSYYYAIFLPHQAEEQANLARAEARAKSESEKKLQNEKKQSEELSRSRYSTCISITESNYNHQWNSSCVRQHNSDMQIKNNCLNNGYGIDYCRSLTIRPSTECALPTNEANAYNATMAEEKQRCLEQMKAGA